MMRRFLVVGLVLLLAATFAPSAFADTGTVTVPISASELGNNLSGTAVADITFTPGPTPYAVHGDWTFTGQLSGQPADGAGTWDGTWTGSQYLGTITSVTAWNGFCSDHFTIFGVTVNVRACKSAPVGQQWNVSKGSVIITTNFAEYGQVSFPLTVQGSGFDSTTTQPLPAPATGSREFKATNTTGPTEIRGLPRTGDVPDWFNYLLVSTFVLGATAMISARRMLRATKVTAAVR